MCSMHTRRFEVYSLRLAPIEVVKPQTWVYVSGPMTGRPRHNYPAFTEAAERLRNQGFIVLNPAENFAGDVTLPRSVYMRADVQHVLMADAIIVLPGWQESPGARLEVTIAEEIGVGIFDLDFEPVDTGRGVVPAVVEASA